MMSDLLARLRAMPSSLNDALRTMDDAADRIEALEAALREIADAPAWGAPDRWETTPFEVRQLARDALEQEK